MTQETKENILDTIVYYAKICNQHPNHVWRGYEGCKAKELNRIELVGRFMRRKGYDVHLGYGTLPNHTDCYLEISKKRREEKQKREKASIKKRIECWVILNWIM